MMITGKAGGKQNTEIFGVFRETQCRIQNDPCFKKSAYNKNGLGDVTVAEISELVPPQNNHFMNKLFQNIESQVEPEQGHSAIMEATSVINLLNRLNKISQGNMTMKPSS